MRTVGYTAWIVLMLGVAVTATASSQAKPIQQTPPATAAPKEPPPDYAFPSGAGMFLFYVKPDKTADFEAVAGKINEVLNRTQDAVRKQQAAGWKIFKSTEAPKDGAIYLFFFDPAVATADYDPVRVLSEGAPADVQALYDRLKDAVIRVERMGLTKMR